MKITFSKILAFMLTAIFMFTGCSTKKARWIEQPPDIKRFPHGSGSLFSFTGNDKGSLEDSFELNFPLAVSVRLHTSTNSDVVETKDRETIRTVFYAIKDIQVTGQAPKYSDDYIIYTFTTADNKSYSYAFADGMYIKDDNGKNTLYIERPENLTSTLAPLHDANNIHQSGNDANKNWVVEGVGGKTYIRNEYGIYRLNKEGDFYRYTSCPAQELHIFGEYIIYSEYNHHYSDCRGIKAFSFTPLSEPYPTKTLYEGTASFIQLDKNGNMYFIGDGLLLCKDITSLITGDSPPTPATFTHKKIAWASLDNINSDAAPLPHNVPIASALSPFGIYVNVNIDAAMHQEMVYLYSLDAKQAKMVENLSDVDFRKIL